MRLFTVPPALRQRRFALFWTGLLISVAGGQMQFWALLWHISKLAPNHPIVVSGIGVVRFVPILGFSLVAGAVADVVNRRLIMFITQTTMMLAAFVLGLLTLAGHIQIWHIYLLTGIQAAASAFDMPARQALTPNLVPRELYPNAFSLQSIAFNTGSIVGPGLSGVVIATLGLHWVYFINAISFLAVLVALVLIGDVSQTGVPATSPRVVTWQSIREGIHFIGQSPIILSSMILDFFATFFSSANTLLPFVAQQVLKVNVLQYGWLSAGQSIGAVSVALLFSQRTNIRRQGKLLLGAVTFFGLATAIFGLSRNFFLTLFALVFIGGSDSVSTILRNTIRQIQTPDYIRGRMVSVNQIFFSGGPQLGEIESGLVAQAFGIPAAIISGGLGCIVAVMAVRGIWPQLWHYNGDEPAAGAAVSAD